MIRTKEMEMIMTIEEAENIVREYADNILMLDAQEQFLFEEAMQLIIETYEDPRDMLFFGGYHYEYRRFDLALKYYEMAADQGDPDALNCLGYIWYYGRTGQKDYAKALDYFSKAARTGNLQAAYKVADMYKNGYGCVKDYEKYKEIIRKLYPKAVRCKNPFEPLPEVFVRMSEILMEEGNTKEAASLLKKARSTLTLRIQNDPYFGNLNIMKHIVTLQKKIHPLNISDIEDDYFEPGTERRPLPLDLFDLYAYDREIKYINFTYEDGGWMAAPYADDDGRTDISLINLNSHEYGTNYRNVEEFFNKAAIHGRKLASLVGEVEIFGLAGRKK